MACDVTCMPDRHCLRRRFFGPRRRMAGHRANADADGRRAFGHHSADCAATHRHQSAADLSTLCEPVCDSIPAKRDGAVPGKALLVAAGIALRISERWSHAWRATPSPRRGEGGVRGLGLLSKYWESVPPQPVLLPVGRRDAVRRLAIFPLPQPPRNDVTSMPLAHVDEMPGDRGGGGHGR